MSAVFMPPDCTAPFTRAEVEYLTTFMTKQADFMYGRVEDAHKDGKTNLGNSLEGIADRLARTSEALGVLAEMMPETPDAETLEERMKLLEEIAE